MGDLTFDTDFSRQTAEVSQNSLVCHHLETEQLKNIFPWRLHQVMHFLRDT